MAEELAQEEELAENLEAQVLTPEESTSEGEEEGTAERA